MNTFSRFLIVALLSVGFVGCLPRGETRTLDQVLSDAQDSYKSANPELVPPAAKTHLDKTAQNVAKLASGSNPTAVTAEIATSIRALIPYAGYTSRASFAELASQLDEASSSGSFNAAAAKLLAARIYSALSIEIATTHFGVTPS